MATIVNDRDKLLQAAPVRFVLPPIDPARIPGLPGAFSNIGQLQQDVEDLGDQINHLMNTSGSFYIRASALAFFGAAGTTTPSTITLTAERGSGLVGGTIAWTVVTGSATISPSSGDSTTVIGSTVTGRSVTIRARLTIDSAVYDAYATITRFGSVSAVDQINLTSQVTGSLAAGNVSGLGALALLNTVNLNTQVTGALNGLTQVTNLGNLAYVNGLAANQIGAGQLAVGVVYAGNINANQVNSGSFVGKTFSGGVFAGALFGTPTATNTALFGYADINFPDQAAIRVQAVSNPSNNYAQMGTGRIWVRNVSTGQIPPILDIHGRATSAVLWTATIQGGLHAIAYDGARAPFKLSGPGIGGSQPSLPTQREAGSLCFYNGHLCVADGSNWFQLNMTQLT